MEARAGRGSLKPRVVAGRAELAPAGHETVEEGGALWTGFRWRAGNMSSGIRSFTRQAATLLRAGFSLDRALAIAASVAEGRVSAVIREVRERVREGQPLASSLAAHPWCFSAFYCGIVSAGERTGGLAEAFERLADTLEHQAQLRSRLMGALLYPAIMSVAGAGAVLVLLLFVIPRFAFILAETGGELPWSARVLLQLSEVGAAAGWIIMVSFLIALLAAVAHRRTRAGRLAQDRLLLRIPIIGPLRARLATERAARTLAGALAGGIRLTEALDIAAGSVADAAFRRELERADEAVRRGERLAAAVRRGGIFPELAVQMIAAGEESGRLVPLLEQVAEAYRAETEAQLRAIVAMVEPAIIVIFGALVGFVALALLQTIYGMGATL